MPNKTSEIAAAARLEEFFGERIGQHLKDRRKRESFAIYAYGILADGERKSVEPIAARACGDPRETNNLHSKLLYFLAGSNWNDRAVRLEAVDYALEAIQEREPIDSWIVDDTGFLKQGTHSVGVQRQYTGSAGKIANCQIGVSLAVATRSEQIPVDFELYLPKTWTEDRARRKEARIPEEVRFKTKPELALDMIRRAVDAGIPGRMLLADAGYGDSTHFRNAVRDLGFDFGVGVSRTLHVVPVDDTGRVRGKAETADALATRLGRGSFRVIKWRDGTKAELSSCFRFVRVKTTHEDGTSIADREPLWLVIEWPSGEPKPTKFILTTVQHRQSRKRIVRAFKERWRTERMYEDLKGELGLDHFEGRSFPGWHHHISVVLCCYAYVAAERARAFPPSAVRAFANGALACAA
jgi:SRSO17 transposase